VALAPIDRATLVYLGIALAFTLAHGPRQAPAAVLLPAGLALAAVVAGVLAPRARREGALGRFLAEFYPLVLTIGLYTHVGLVNAARGVSHDGLVQAWERALFGGQPSLDWIRAFPSPAWSTLMHAAYLSYYVVLVAAPVGMWLAGRRAPARVTLLLTMTAFYLCYSIFLAFPVAGPRYVFPPAQNPATAVPVAAFTHRLLEGGSAWGTAFPSSHVAAALVAACCAWRGLPPLGMALVPLSLLLSLATVYGQFHYAVDALAGGALALVVLYAGRRAGYDAGAAVPDTSTDPHTHNGVSRS
jgi:membrane-associated phospholipid phosphatase